MFFKKIVNVSNQSSLPLSSPLSSSLPILSLADYTTSQGVPTATALANQAKLRPTKQESILATRNNDISMSTDEYNEIQNDSNPRIKVRRGRVNKSMTTSNNKRSAIDAIQYGPIIVKPRKYAAPTLSNGRKSKDEQVRIKSI